MKARAMIGKNKGCDAIDWDNVDGYSNDSGFPLVAADQIAYNTMLAEITHELDMGVGLKNDIDQVEELVSLFDFAVNEQCQQYNECDALMAFIQAGKPVWAINYSGIKKTTACVNPNKWGFMMLLKNMDLDAAGYQCWQQLTTLPASSSSSSSSSSSLKLASSTLVQKAQATAKTSSSSSTTKAKTTTTTTTSSSRTSLSTSTTPKAKTTTTTTTSKSTSSTSTSQSTFARRPVFTTSSSSTTARPVFVTNKPAAAATTTKKP